MRNTATRPRNIMIVGAGQAGLQLALALQRRGDHVTLASNRSAEDIRTGRVMSSQCMFDASLQIERDLGLELWADDCPPVEGIALAGEAGATVSLFVVYDGSAHVFYLPEITLPP